MSECLSCKNISQDYYLFSVIEIQTLHIRDVKGERYVQAMGEQKEYQICSDCAKEYLESVNHPVRNSKKSLIIFGILILIGAVALFTIRSEELFVNLFGPIAIACGMLGIGVTLKNAFDGRNAFQRLSSEDAVYEAAWRLTLEKAPKKYKDSDLTYVPVNKKTRGMNVQQLEASYDLLPPIAAKVKQALHADN